MRFISLSQAIKKGWTIADETDFSAKMCFMSGERNVSGRLGAIVFMLPPSANPQPVNKSSATKADTQGK